MIGELLGIPEDKRQEVHILADRLFTRGDDVGTSSEDAATAMLELGLLLYDVVVERRKQPRATTSSAC